MHRIHGFLIDRQLEMTPTKKAALNLLNTQKAIHAFKLIGNKWEPAHDGAQPNIGKIL
jgi:hypothetical protein